MPFLIDTKMKDDCRLSMCPKNVCQKKGANHEGANPTCACCCVPKILSLFEMAELRKKARGKKAAETNLKWLRLERKLAADTATAAN